MRLFDADALKEEIKQLDSSEEYIVLKGKAALIAKILLEISGEET